MKIQGSSTGFDTGNGSILYAVREICRYDTKDTKRSLKQHMEYINFRSNVQFDHPVDAIKYTWDGP